MKKLVAITGIMLMLCLFTGVAFSPATSAQTESVQATVNNNEQNMTFVLKAENNRITVYKKGESTPYMTTDTPVDSLPKGDIMLLELGIEIEGEKNLKKSLEDYCS
ncbi:MAG: hypothetical protein UHD05_03405 [Ruminococcus sp.]|nr:hypothetical protein [Ruminococcus sp.]